MKLKFKKLHPDAVVPSYAKPGDAGLDLTAAHVSYSYSQTSYGTGLAVEIPEGYVGLLFPRSSIFKTSLALSNCVGVIDSGYRGEIKAVFNREKGGGSGEYKIGERLIQLIVMPFPKMEIEEVDELTSTERGDTGFGSSGK